MGNAFEDAAAGFGGNQGTSAGAGVVNPLPFQGGENPFGAPSQFKGGAFTPNPPFEALVGRTVVMIPRSYNPTAHDPFATEAGKTRKLWTVDLYVLDGGTLRFWYTKKGQDGGKDETVEQVAEVSPESPYMVEGMWVAQSAFISKLTGVSENRQFLLTTVARGATMAQRQSGKTDEDVRAEHKAWSDRGKQGKEPRSVWLPTDVDQQGMQNAMTWWAANKDSIKL